jgi:transposase InsO family protein
VRTYRFIQQNREWYAIREMAGLLGVSSSAYYPWTKHGVLELAGLIREIVVKQQYRYGSPGVREGLRWGRVSRKKVAHLMRENGLNARRRRKFIRSTDSRHTLPVCPNILSRQFHAERGGEKWVSSYQRYAITYLRMGGGWVYLTVVLDRNVIGWAISADMETAHMTIPPWKWRVPTGRPIRD